MLPLLSYEYFLIILCAATTTGGYLTNESKNIDQCTGKNKQICIKPACVHAAAHILKAMDQTIDPCDDFYKFACGKYVEETYIPDDVSYVSRASEISNLVQKQLKLILEESIQPNEPRFSVLFKKLYQRCMDTSAIEKDSLERVKALIQELGGWPLVEGINWNEEAFDWRKTIYKFREKGLKTNYFMQLSINKDSQNETFRIINFDQAVLPYRKEFFMDSKKVKAYYTYLVNLATAYGAESENFTKEIEESINFQISLAKIIIPRALQRNYTVLTNKMTIRELKLRHPNFPWLEYINGILGSSDITASDDEIVNVSVPQFIFDLEILLQETPKRVLANYLIGCTANDFVIFVNKSLIEMKMAIYSTTKKLPLKWKECVAVATSRLSLSASAVYIRKYFDDAAKKDIEQIFTNLKEVLIKSLKTIDWMDEITKAEAVEKAQLMSANIAYAPELLDDEIMNKYYSELESSESYLTFILNYQKFITDKYFRKLRKPRYKNDWKEYITATTVNAAYNIYTNNIKLPAGILQGVFFDQNRPNYMNYAGIGFAIGHEITHGFDDLGRQTDKNGLLRNWWSEETSNTFTKKARCFIEQYGNITYLDLPVNGVVTQGENIADNGGIKKAYLAYNSWVEKNEDELQLPGLNYASNQLFWISAANVWCSKQREEYVKRIVLTDTHVPPNIRVNGMLSNTRYFANDFKCPLGSKMNPINKCSIW